MDEETAARLSLEGKGAADGSHVDFGGHVKAVAHARFVLRRIMRLLDEQAVAGGLQPLHHQTLLQIYGAENPLPVNKVAERMDIAPALASRTIRRLEEKGLVERSKVSNDRRVIAVTVTDRGIELLRRIDQSVCEGVRDFHRQLTEEGKFGALATFAFYIGLDSDPRLHLLLAGAPEQHRA